MNDQPLTADEQEDAEFRARLAPLASEVLPMPPMAERRPTGRGWPAAAIAAVVALLGAAWLGSKWPWPEAPVVTPKPVVQDPAAAMTELLLRRGDAALADGDIVGARLLFERAAALGSPAAATGAGKTYDTEFLSRAGARGIPADQAAATAWFRKAAALGDPEARARLARAEPQGRR